MFVAFNWLEYLIKKTRNVKAQNALNIANNKSERKCLLVVYKWINE